MPAPDFLKFMIRRDFPSWNPIGRSLTLAALPILGLVLVGVGTALPWVTIYRGLTVLRGLDGDGSALSGLAAGAVLLWVIYLRAGRPLPLQLLAASACLLTAGYAAFDVWRITRYVAAPGPTGPLATPVFGPGSVVVVAGGTVLLAAVLLTPTRQRHLPPGLSLPLLAAAALFAAGWIHLMLTGPHLQEATILGLGFLVAGVAQVALGIVIGMRPGQLAYHAVVAVNASLIFLYVYAVVRGLPIGSDDHGGGLVLGSGEAVDLAGAVSKGAELLSLVLAFVLLGAGSSRPDLHSSP